MSDEIAGLLASVGGRVIRLKDKQKVRAFLTSEATSAVRLRAALSIGERPTPELVDAQVISQALSLEDCWRFFSQLAKEKRVLEAGETIEAIRRQIGLRQNVNLNAVVTRLLKLTAQWEAARIETIPSANTVSQLLRLAETILDRPITKGRRKSKGSSSSALLCRLIERAIGWTVANPSVENLVIVIRCLKIAEQRQGLRLRALYDERPGLADQVRSIRDLLANQVVQSASRNEIDDFRTLLRAFSELPGYETEANALIDQLASNRTMFDQAISKVISEFTEDERSSGLNIQFADGREATSATVQLAAALLRAWAARNDGPKASEAYEELRIVLEPFFGLRLHDWVGQLQQYNSSRHEFAAEDAPSSMVEVIRPAIELIKGGEATIVIKALVRPTR